MRKSLVLLVLLTISQAAWAQFVRFLPPVGERGKTGQSLALPDVMIDKKVLRLAPGGVIVDQNNRTILHGHLPVGAEVFFTRTLTGDIQRMYILTAEEQARLKANPPSKPPPVPVGAPAAPR